MNGKSKCKILKEIRREIAERNDIEYVTSECRFQGDCTGTCPKCEAELKYLEDELRKRQRAGKAVAVAGIAAAWVVGSAGCVWMPPEEDVAAGDVPYVEQTDGRIAETDPTEVIIQGDIPAETQEGPEAELPMGDIPLEDPTEETCEVLVGDVAYEE